MSINITQFTNTTGDDFIGLTLAVNNASGGVFGFSLLLSLYLISFFAMLPRFGGKNSFAAAAFLGAICALLLRLMGLIIDEVLYGAIVLAVIGAVVLYLSRD